MTLAPKLSFTDDSSSNFPIRGENLGDGKIASDRPTAIFFGTSHCWNTNREAERFVALYEKKKEAARFLVVDLEHPSSEQQALVSKFNRGYIPTLAFLDSSGRVVYNQAGETSNRRRDISKLEAILARAGTAARIITKGCSCLDRPWPGLAWRSAAGCPHGSRCEPSGFS